MPYHDQWKIMFEEEAKLIDHIMGSEILEIYHIGSTSVRGLMAKPIIDIMPVVKDISQIDRFNSAMVAIGYEPKGENGIIGRRYFQKGGDMRSHHVHIYESGSSEIERHLAFRDFLQVHEGIAKQYGDLKKELSLRFPYDIQSYIKGKERLVIEIEQKALVWYRETGENARNQA